MCCDIFEKQLHHAVRKQFDSQPRPSLRHKILEKV